MARIFTPIEPGRIGDNPKVRRVPDSELKQQLWQSEVGLLPYDTQILLSKADLISFLKVGQRAWSMTDEGRPSASSSTRMAWS